MATIQRVELFCDRCGDRCELTEVTSFLIEIQGRVNRVDLCDTDAKPVLEAFQSGVEVTRTGKNQILRISDKVTRMRDGATFAVNEDSTFQYGEPAPVVGMVVTDGTA